MSETLDDEIGATTGDTRRRAHIRQVVIVFAVLIPGLALRIGGFHAPDPLAALLFGVAIVGAAFVLSWAAEVAQLDISAGLAISLLALIAVLPEYAVDLVFALTGGHAVTEFGPACQSVQDKLAGRNSPCSLALANMTGGNRLLIGIGWSLVVFVGWRASKRSKNHRETKEVRLERSHSVEIAFLTLACCFSLSLPLFHSISMFQGAVLVSIFVLYTIRVSRAPAEVPHLVGPAEWMGTFPTTRRRATVVALFVVAAGVILLCAEHFAESLVATGRQTGIDEFLLVQWLAPLASEAPELLIAGLYAWRLNASTGLGALVSSKVNQWTLLVGTLPVAFAIASGSLHGLPIIAEQRDELFLTAAQSIFAVAVLASLSLSLKEAGMLFGLFMAQFLAGAVVTDKNLHAHFLIAFGAVYLVLAAILLVRERSNMARLLKDGFRTPYRELTSAEEL